MAVCIRRDRDFEVCFMEFMRRRRSCVDLVNCRFNARACQRFLRVPLRARLCARQLFTRVSASVRSLFARERKKALKARFSRGS